MGVMDSKKKGCGEVWEQVEYLGKAQEKQSSLKRRVCLKTMKYERSTFVV
jgi:hypothetical protein